MHLIINKRMKLFFSSKFVHSLNRNNLTPGHHPAVGELLCRGGQLARGQHLVVPRLEVEVAEHAPHFAEVFA